jgi:hypothetical protein
MKNIFYLLLFLVFCSCAPRSNISEAYGTGPGGNCAENNGKYRVFNTSATYYGADIGGLTGADTLCATAASLAGICGNFVAYLSTDSINAIDRIATGGPWYNPSQTVMVFSSIAQLRSAANVPINWDQYGNTISSTVRWTGSLYTGELSFGTTCSGWTAGGNSGEQANVNATSLWSGGNFSVSCTATAAPILCFEL